uniref:Uncharacterized protein n=1 Tax=Rangifer tarandus platyrhynchus TaxID=3082113 RepID=A0ACB0EZX7_RANTA|nr:unnamed protein product [Rangifer tarandus platyrhynchus]
MEVPEGWSTSAAEERTALLTTPTSPGVLTLGLILQGGRSSGGSAGARGNGWDLGYRVTARARERGA